MTPMARTNDRAVDPSTAARPLRIVLHGANGRMGARILACVPRDGGAHVVQALDRDDDLAVLPGQADVVIDFSSDEGAARAARHADRLGCALLVGTTGLSQASLEAIAIVAQRIPACVAPNTSLGVAVVRDLVRQAAQLLPGYHVDIVETHHAHKLDAPSGTARSLAAAVHAGSGMPMPPERIHAIRSGDVVGDHEVVFSGPGERISIRHHATDRDLFAMGALRLARWLVTRPPGMHAMEASNA
jgi:4-hydroxy-tetrahydrodipicolinate reductase